MKKYFSMIVLAMMAMCSTMLVSCGGDSSSETPVTKVFKNAEVICKENFNADFLSVYDVTKTIKNFDGTTTTEHITEAVEKEYSLTTESKNASANITYTIKVREDFVPDTSKVYVLQGSTYYVKDIHYTNGQDAVAEAFNGVVTGATTAAIDSKETAQQFLKNFDYLSKYSVDFKLADGQFVLEKE